MTAYFCNLLRKQDTSLRTLLVAEGLNGIKVGGANGGDHAADQAGDDEDYSGNDDGGRSDHEADVGGLSILGECAVKGDAADHEGDQIGEGDASDAADAGDGEGFGKKLNDDVAPARAQSFFDADFASALLHRDEHDVHEADAGD